MIDIKDKIISFYKNTNLVKSQPKPPKELLQNNDYTLFNYNAGIGDALVLYLFNKREENYKNINVNFNPDVNQELKKYNPYIASIYSSFLKNNNLWVCVLQADYDCGGGHFIQKLRRSLGFDFQIKPKPILNSNIQTVKDKVVFTFDRGKVIQNHIHNQPRILYPESKKIIQEFINNNLNKYSFIEVGRTFSGLENVENKTNLGIEKTTEEIASCEYFCGMHNGLMHIAAAFDKKSIIIINFPSAKNLYLPAIKELTIHDQDWLYPQNVHLHQDEDGELVKQLSLKNIEKAFNGEIYPFWNDSFLELLNK